MKNKIIVEINYSKLTFAKYKMQVPRPVQVLTTSQTLTVKEYIMNEAKSLLFRQNINKTQSTET